MSDNPDRPARRRPASIDLLLIALGVCPGCGGMLNDDDHRTEVVEVVGRQERPGVWRVEWSCCDSVEFIEAETDEKARAKIRPDMHECRTPAGTGPHP